MLRRARFVQSGAGMDCPPGPRFKAAAPNRERAGCLGIAATSEPVTCRWRKQSRGGQGCCHHLVDVVSEQPAVALDGAFIVRRGEAAVALVVAVGGRGSTRATGPGSAGRGNPLPPDPERFWRHAFHALITGYATTPPPSRPQRMTRPPHRAAASRPRN